MEKVIRCRDVGFDCDGVIKAPTEKEALALAAEHAKKVHGVKDITPEIVQKIKSVMREEPARTR
jgi:predicted small metal-binding protein